MSETTPLPFLPGWNVDLRPPRKETDFETCLAGINDPEIRQFLKNDLPTYKPDEEEWFEKRMRRSETNIPLAIQTKQGEFLGMTGLHHISWKDGTARTGTVIFRKDFWGRGMGVEAKMLLLNYGFNTIRLRRIASAVYAFNERSLRCQLRCGYQEEGRFRAHTWKQRYLNGVWDNGAFYDVIQLGLLREEWLPLGTESQKRKGVGA